MTSNEYSVKKRNGLTEQLNLQKLHTMVEHAVDGIGGVSASQIEMNSHIQFFDGITTSQIQEILIKSAADLISEEYPNYQFAAARLKLFALRKEVWQSQDAPTILETVNRNVAVGVYESTLASYYSDDEWKKINTFIKHERDLDLTYAGIKQIYDKYLVQNRVTQQRYETPQEAYILIAAVLFKDYPADTRLSYVKRYYDAISLQRISLPTPVIAGVRTPTRQFASCVLIEVDDSMDSITTSVSSVCKYISQRAGIGLSTGRIRGLNAMIRNGDVKHTGLIPFLKLFQAAVGSSAQGGIRNGAATTHFPIWHWEMEDILVLKNNKGTDDNRVRQLDYSIGMSRLFYRRYINNESITLFSPEEVPGLYESFGDNDKFDELYVKYEKKRGIRKKVVSMRDLFDTLVSERADTGRIYIYNIDHMNSHSSFTDNVIRMSNLCQEITLPTKPIDFMDDTNGEIATCILSAVNLGKVKELSDLEDTCDLAVRSLDALIDYQEYPLKAAEASTRKRRNLGVGFTNLAYYLAKNKVRWDSDDARKLMHETTEAFQYYLLKASNDLAKEVGQCSSFEQTKYSNGILPIDTYKIELDEVADFELKMDWDKLRRNITVYGLRNSTLSAQMPCESSSAVVNATNGIEPPRAYLQSKKSKSGVIKILVPEYSKLKNQYELLWRMPTMDGYLKVVAIMQKFFDQSISTNTSYNPMYFEDDSIPMSVLVKDILTAYKLGVKTLYYQNTYDMNEMSNGSGCESGACSI